jgi:photosystem II stability/assembly factor-like uncharacterized protein
VGRLPADAGARSVLIDPEQPQRVYVTTEATLYRSDDAGRTWEPGAERLPEGGVAAVVLDPRTPGRLYAVTTAGTLFTSEDGAGSWRALTDARGSPF